MSLINDALKRAREQTGGQPVRMPLVVPAGNAPRSGNWILPVVILLMIAAAGFLISLSFIHHTSNTGPKAIPATAVAPVPALAAPPPPVSAPIQETAVVPVVSTNVPPSAKVLGVDTSGGLPRLQGVLYDPVHPAAIINGKTLHVGDSIVHYRVKAISKFTVTLTSTQGTDSVIQLGQ